MTKTQKYTRKVPAERGKDKGFTKLTTKQWAVYYWLLSQAYWNSEKRENHYFVYRDKICYSAIQRELGIGSVNTIKSALEVLEMKGRICICNDVIILPNPEEYTYLHIDMIKYLLGYSKIFGAELVLFYSLLKRLFEYEKRNKKKLSFAIKLFVLLMGHNEADKNEYKKLKAYISFFKGEGLIQVSETQRVNKGGVFIEYTLHDIKQALPLENYIDIDGEKTVVISSEKLEEYKKVINFKV